MPTKRPSSPQLQAVPARRDQVQLAVVAENVTRELTPEAAERSVRVKLRARTKPTVLGDPTELFRALASLVAYGIRRAPPGTTVLVQLAVDEGRALIDVLDEGAGVASPEDDALALTSARNVVRGHGGEIALVACGYGHVHVELPLVAEPTTARN